MTYTIYRLHIHHILSIRYFYRIVRIAVVNNI